MKSIHCKMGCKIRSAGRPWGLLSLALILSVCFALPPWQPDAFGAVNGALEAKTGGRGDAAAGKLIYERHCHYCHGTKGYGDGPVGTAITPHPADFVHDKKRMLKSDKKLFKSIRDGVKRKIGGEAMVMPMWGHILSDEDIWNVLAYVRELQRRGRELEAAELRKTGKM